MPWCLEPFAEGRRRASTMGSCAACQQQAPAILRRYEAIFFWFPITVFILYVGKLWRPPQDMHEIEGGAVGVSAGADILKSCERRRIGFHDRVVQGCGVDSAPGCTDGCLEKEASDVVLDIIDGGFFFKVQNLTISAEDNSTGCWWTHRCCPKDKKKALMLFWSFPPPTAYYLRWKKYARHYGLVDLDFLDRKSVV